MRTQKFGIEIEMTGITRAAAAQVIAGHFSASATHVGGGYDTYTVRDNDNRQWKVVSDASIHRESRRGLSSNGAYSVEFVSPICKYEDIGSITVPRPTPGSWTSSMQTSHVYGYSGVHLVQRAVWQEFSL